MDALKFLAFSCPHCPLEDADAVDWVIEQIKKNRPDVIVHLGDGHEADSASRWPTEYNWSLSDEFEAHNSLLQRLRRAAPDAKRVFLWGNHDDNLLSLNRIDKRIRSLCDPNDHEPELKHWRQVPYDYSRKRGCWRLGQVTFAHGYEAGVSSDEMQSYLLGVPFGLYVGGHTHQPKQVEQGHRTKAIPLPYWFCNAGTVGDMNRDYMKRKRSHHWGQAVVIGEAVPLKSPRHERYWDARTEFFRMYE